MRSHEIVPFYRDLEKEKPFEFLNQARRMVTNFPDAAVVRVLL